MSNTSSEPPTHSRAPSVVIAFRTFWRTVKHGYENLGVLSIISLIWIAGIVVFLPITLLIMLIVQNLLGASQYELLLLPAGPLTAAVQRVVQPMAEERVPRWREIFGYVRADWRWSTQLMAVLIGVSIMLQVNIRYYLSFNSTPFYVIALVFVTMLIVWGGVALYAFPLALRQEELRVRITLRNAVIMSIANAPGVLVSVILLLLLTTILLIPPLFVLIPGIVMLWGQENTRLLLVAGGYIAKDPIADRER